LKGVKKYALGRKQSLSRIMEAYLQSLTMKRKGYEIVVSLFVESMSKGKSIPGDWDSKKIYGDCLLRKNK